MKTDMRLVCAVWLVMLAFAAPIQCERCGKVLADQWPEWTEEAKLDLGRCIQAESSFKNINDARGIAWVITKRWKKSSTYLPITRVIRNYCAMWDERSTKYYSKRSIWLREAQWEKSTDSGSRRLSTRLRTFVERFTARKEPDPCIRAIHWGGPMDPVPSNWVAVCQPPKTLNTFYRIERDNANTRQRQHRKESGGRAGPVPGNQNEAGER